MMSLIESVFFYFFFLKHEGRLSILIELIKVGIKLIKASDLLDIVSSTKEIH